MREYNLDAVANIAAAASVSFVFGHSNGSSLFSTTSEVEVERNFCQIDFLANVIFMKIIYLLF